MKFEDLNKNGNVFFCGVAEELLGEIERESGIVFPEDYRSLLRYSDGCMLQSGTFLILFSCGLGMGEEESLRWNNAMLQNDSMYFIGRFAGDSFGYLKNSEDKRIYSYCEEDGRHFFEADSLDALLLKSV